MKVAPRQGGRNPIALCALCAAVRELRLSHIIPAFVIRWLKETSGTGFMRSGTAPNVRVQDGFKDHLLCNDCEQLLSGWENRVAAEIFVPHANGDRYRFEYGPWFSRFAVSLAWRGLIFMMRAAPEGVAERSEGRAASMRAAADAWAQFLLGRTTHVGKHHVHALPVPMLKAVSHPEDTPPTMNRYLQRTFEIDIVESQVDAFVYVKIPSIIFIGQIEPESPAEWKGTQIRLNAGSFGGGIYESPRGFENYLYERAEAAARLQSQVSKPQRKKISEAVARDPARVRASQSVRAFERDLEVFGPAAFSPDEESEE